jgi:hypothetical protein
VQPTLLNGKICGAPLTFTSKHAFLNNFAAHIYTMKKLTLLLLLSIAFFSCSNDPYYAPGVYRGTIEGRWSTRFSTKPDFENINTSNCNTVNVNGLYWTFIFNNDNSFTLLNTCTGAILEKGTYTYYGGQLLLDLDNTSAYITSTIIFEGDNRIRMDNYRKSNGATEGFNVVLVR